MRLLSTLWRLATGGGAASAGHPHSVGPGTDFARSRSTSSSSPTAVRKDLLRLVLRGTLTRNGIPSAWIGADALGTSSRSGDPGLHVRFVVRHWDPRIALHAPALQEDFDRRLLSFDPLASAWLRGYSWRYELPEGAPVPELPHPGSWSAPLPAAARSRGTQAQAPAAASDDPIIAGPVVIGARARPARRMADVRPESTEREDFESANTEPAPLDLTRVR